MSTTVAAIDRSTSARQEHATAGDALFQLGGGERGVFATGCRQRLPRGPAQTLGQRVAAFFASNTAPELPLVGMLPFDPAEADALHQPRRLLSAVPAGGQDEALTIEQVVAEPAPVAWADTVARSVAALQAQARMPDGLHKVVLARSLRVDTATPVALPTLLRRLGGDAAVTTYAAPVPVASGQPPAWLVGATPELLLSRRGRTVVSNPLAGSAPRSSDPQQDAAAADALLASTKDREEHRYVVDAIRTALAPLCRHLHVPAQPSLQATQSLWHLGTRIEGELAADVSAAELAARLHPTPAVCGTPRAKALSAIRARESVARGFYAGAVGWVDAAGDGDWYVAIRCARVQACTLRLFAGAGIVAASQPQSEVTETGAKFRAMLDALGFEATAEL